MNRRLFFALSCMICTGTGFPENSPQVMFYGGEQELQIVEIWARDAAGNLSSGLCSLIILDNQSYCDPSVAIFTSMPDGQGITKVQVDISGQHCLYHPVHWQLETHVVNSPLWGNAGISQMGILVPAAGYLLDVTPTKDTLAANGVSTFDLYLIQKHLLGIEPLDSPYKIMAADANQDGQLTSFDLFLLQQLILGATTELPNGRSWRFIPQDFIFPNPANPFETPVPDRIETLPPDPSYNGVKLFYGVKIGDVNYSANPGE